MRMPGVEEGEGERVSRAAYLMVKGSICEDLTSREEFMAALRYAGHSLTLTIHPSPSPPPSPSPFTLTLPP